MFDTSSEFLMVMWHVIHDAQHIPNHQSLAIRTVGETADAREALTLG
ncbi:hypothetical protein [Myxococcus sp. CA033]|nr:hypothetical protein [Myxococcus sp. CA033]